jgi:hypothetical protein
MSFRPSRRFAASVRIDETPARRGRSSSGQRSAATASTAAVEPDLEESADLYYRRPPKALAYRHFESAEIAIRFIGDNLSAVQIANAVLQVGEQRFEGNEIASLVKRQDAGRQRASAPYDA